MNFKIDVGFFHWKNPALVTKKSFNEKVCRFILRFFAFSPIVHCDIRIYNDKIDMTLFAIENKQVCFYETDSVHKLFGKPNTIVPLGNFDLDISKIDYFLFPKYCGNRWDLYKWYFFKRFLFLSKPKTCTMAVCQILQDRGLPISKYVMPNTLFRELLNAPSNLKRKSWSWKNYFG
tara:strand:+ start:571 stop:1098 length:528 start_codon:yes stop_codon:yes gene_type:complete